METKILFADIDGTLLNDQKEIPKENMTAIQKALDLGHYVVVATGRPLDSAKAVAKDLGLMSKNCLNVQKKQGFTSRPTKEIRSLQRRIPRS